MIEKNKIEPRILMKIPIDPKISAACDKGMIELYDSNFFEEVTKTF